MNYLCLIDESGREIKRDSWFMWGGLAVPKDQVHLLHRDIWRIRVKAGYPMDQPLKWQRPRGKGTGRISSEAHDRAVDHVLVASLNRSAKLFVVLTPAGITATTQKGNRSIQICIADILGILQRFFLQEQDHGIVLVDNPHGAARMSTVEDVLLSGVPAGIGGSLRKRRFGRITCTGITSVGSSPLMIGIDVSIGALNYCLSCSESSLDRAIELYGRLNRLISRPGSGPLSNPWGWGIKIRPSSFREVEFYEFANSGVQRLIGLGEERPRSWHRPQFKVDIQGI